MTVGVVGLGYVGLPLAVALAGAGERVVGFDVDQVRVDALRAGRAEVDGVDDGALQGALEAGLRVTDAVNDLGTCDAVVICVPTPLTDEGRPDTSHIESAVAEIATIARPGLLVVLESTSYPGTTEELVAARLEALTGLSTTVDLCVAFSPERIDPGNATYGIANTPRVVAGLHDCCRDRAAALYSQVVDEVVPAAGLREAELAKLLENTYRQVNIALMNELARFAHLMDIDLYESIRCASTKPFGFQSFRPGPGVGGHCIPIDPRFLAARIRSELGREFRFVELAQEINDAMPAYVVERLAEELQAHGTSLPGARVLVLGVAYKADVSDVRQSPALDVIRHLWVAGADVSYADPHVGELVVDGVPVPRTAPPQGTDVGWGAVLVLQPHAAFADLDPACLAPVVLDCTATLGGRHASRL